MAVAFSTFEKSAIIQNLDSAAGVSGNLLLARLSHDDKLQLESTVHTVLFEQGEVLFRMREPIHYVYFPVTAVLSVLTVMTDGKSIETATVGYEGMVGLTAFAGDGTAPNQLIAQIPGLAFRMEVGAFTQACEELPSFRQIIARYHTAYSMQVSYAVACNGLHTVEKRCCRWLLMTQDRTGMKVLPLTQEFLAIMLGVRRASVSEVLRPLHTSGVISAGRGKIEILDRAHLESLACECYGVVNEDFARLLGQVE